MAALEILGGCFEGFKKMEFDNFSGVHNLQSKKKVKMYNVTRLEIGGIGKSIPSALQISLDPRDFNLAM